MTLVVQELSVRVIMHMENDTPQGEFFNHVHNFEVMDYETYFPWYLGYCNLKQSFATCLLLYTLSYTKTRGNVR